MTKVLRNLIKISYDTIFALPNFNEEFQLKRVASGVGISAFMTGGKGCLVTFQFSRKKLNEKRKQENKKGPLMKDLYTSYLGLESVGYYILIPKETMYLL